MRYPPQWAIDCEIKMLRPKMTKRQLANEIHKPYKSVCKCMSGLLNQDDIIDAICQYFSVER